MPDELRFWHVTLTLGGDAHEPSLVKAGLVRLGGEHAFLHSLRFSAHRAEIRYWEEAAEMLDAAAMALRVWHEHRRSAGLPRWEVVGLEILERGTFSARCESRVLVGVGINREEPVPF